MYSAIHGESAVVFSNWLSTYFAKLQQSNRRDARKPLPRVRKGGSVVEVMEDRTLLSVVSLIGGDLSALPGSLAVSQRSSAADFRDAGDFYLYGNEEISLLRAENEILVRFADSVDTPASALAAIAGRGVSSKASPSSGSGQGNSSVGRVASQELLDPKTGILRFETVAAARSGALALKGRSSIEWIGTKFSASEGADFVVVTDEIIVALHPGVDPDSVFDSKAHEYQRLSGTANQYVVTIHDGFGSETLQASREFQMAPLVRFASPNFYRQYTTTSVPNDTQYSDQWHLQNDGNGNQLSGADANLEDAWDTETGSDDIVAAVFDTGVDVDHEDLNIFVNVDEIPGNSIDDDGNGWIDDVNGWDFNDDDNDPSPNTNDAHGTAVAGVLGAVGNNSTGVTGAAQKVQIMPIKLFDNDTFVSDATLAAAVYYAAGRTKDGLGVWRGADISNHSWGGPSAFSAAVDTAFDWSESDGRGGLGTASFAATGNAASAYKSYPHQFAGHATDTYRMRWIYAKDSSGSDGDDTAWLGQVTFPDGTVQKFDSATMPAGWGVGGDANWTIASDPAHTYGTGAYVAKAGSITHNEISILESPSFTATTAGEIEFKYWVSSEAGKDGILFYLSTNGGAFTLLSSNSGVESTNLNVFNQDVSYPAAISSVIAVGASTDRDYRSDYSQYGTGIDFVAPSNGGFEAITTADETGSPGYDSGNYHSGFGGTSSATPLAAGIGALLLARNPGLSADDLRDALQDSAVQIGGTPITYDVNGWNEYYGHGRVDADGALDEVTADTTGPSVTTYSISADSGISSTDELTNDTTPVLTFEFSERTVWDTADISVVAPDSSTVTITSAMGAGTDTLEIVLPTLTQNGTYTVTLASASDEFRDQTGNALNSSTDVVETFVLDTTAPTGIAITSSDVDENVVAGTVVGVLSATGAGTITLSLTDDASGRFELVGSNLRATASPSLDHEADASHSVTVRATDTAGNFLDESFTIDVNDLAEVFVVSSTDWATSGITIKQVGLRLHAYDIGTSTDAVDSHLLSSVTSISVTGSSADNELELDFSGGEFVPAGGLSFDGAGDSSGDTLSLTGGTFTTITHTLTSTSAGTIDVDGQDVTYTNMENVADDAASTNRVFTFGSSADNVTVADDLTAANDVSKITSVSSSVPVEFDSPSGSLTVNAGTGNDTVALSSIDSLFTATTTVNGENDADSLSAALWSLGTTLNGGSGNDTLTGGTGNDSLKGATGDDSIDGGDGVDSVYGDNGDDTLDGGDGDDIVNGGNNEDIVRGGADNDDLRGGTGNDTLYGDAGDDTLTGSSSSSDAEEFHGGLGDDSVWALSGVDIIYGDEGNDSLYGHSGNDEIHGGDGDDLVVGDVGDTTQSNAGVDTLYGDAGNDTVQGGLLDDLIYGGDGNDLVQGDNGNDTLWGGDGDDSVNGLNGDDELHGEAGNDFLRGGDDSDTLHLEEGTDTLNGGNDAGVDTLFASVNEDVTVTNSNLTIGTEPADTLTDIDKLDLADGALSKEIDASAVTDFSIKVTFGGGDDTVKGGSDSADEALFLDLSGDTTLDSGVSQDTLTNGSDTVILEGVEKVSIYGDSGANEIDASGYTRNVTLGGDQGDDTLIGGSGDDNLNGSGGADVITGGDGDDKLIGGGGTDVFHAADDSIYTDTISGSASEETGSDWDVGSDIVPW